MRPDTLFASLVALSSAVAQGASITRENNHAHRDTSRSALERAQSLLARMTWEEKIGQMGGVRRLFGPGASFNSTSFQQIYDDLQQGQIGKRHYPSALTGD